LPYHKDWQLHRLSFFIFIVGYIFWNPYENGVWSLLKPTLNGFSVDASYHCWIQFFALRLGWLPLDASLANIYAEDIKLTEKNKKLVELTTATGYHSSDLSKIDYYFGNLDDRRIVWSIGRDLIMQPPEGDGPVNSLPKMYVEVDGKQSTDGRGYSQHKHRPSCRLFPRGSG
jgi:hypothetical protein